MLIPAIHYVDDLGSVDPASSAESSFQSFDSFCSILGFRLRPSKRQPPGAEQKLQGVVVRIAAEGVFVALSESRVFKLRQSLRQTLLQDRLTPDEAARLAGKLGFLSTSLWGQVGLSLIRPIYGRSQGMRDGATSLDSGLRASMECISRLRFRASFRSRHQEFRSPSCMPMLISSWAIVSGLCLMKTYRLTGHQICTWPRMAGVSCVAIVAG